MEHKNTSSQPAIALIGCGAIAEKYYLPTLMGIDGILDRLILVDNNLQRAKELAERFNVRRTAANYHDVIQDVRGAIVAVPHHLHFPITRDFLNAHIHVLCEKPLAEKASEVREMARLARANEVTISANNTRRLIPPNIVIRQMIEAGELGTLRMITYLEGTEFDWPTASGFYFNSRLSQKGILLDVGAHALDVMCQWFGEKPEIVSAEIDSFGGREAVACVKLRHGECRAVVRLSWLSKLPNTFRLVGDKGIIEGRIFDWKSVTFTSPDGHVRTVHSEMGYATPDDFMQKPVVNFIKILTAQEPPLIPAESVVPSIELIEESYATARRFPMPWYTVREPVAKEARILVTGAAGFIGGWIAESGYARGYTNVRAGVRRWSGAARIARFPMDIVLCDVMKPEEIARAMEGVDVVIHCATGSKEVNVKGTENLLDAALKAGVRRFVHFSTVDVYGTTEGQISESAPFQQTGSDYGDSKIEAEGLCARYSERGLPVVIFRPSIVYGPYCKLWISKFAERLSSGNWGIFEKLGEGTCNLIYIEDLIDAIVLSIENEKAIGQTFNLNGSEMITWNEYFRRLNAALGLPPLRLIGFGRSKLRTRVMTPLKSAARYVMNNYGDTLKVLYHKSALARRLMKGTELSMKTTPGPGELSMFGRKPEFDASKIAATLGFKPKFGIDRGIEMSVQWYSHESRVTHESATSSWDEA